MNHTIQQSLAAAAALAIVIMTFAPLIVVPVDPVYAAGPVLA